MIENFTPLPAVIGGTLIGLSASAMLFLQGRVLGVSGIVGGLLRPIEGEVIWRAMFIAGMLAGGLVLLVVAPDAIAGPSERSLTAVGVAGLLVGVGTRLGNGCTSGHGVCGLTRRSPRSAVATATFLTTGLIAATLAPILLGGR